MFYNISIERRGITMWWEILGIEYTEDEAVIKHAYFKLVSKRT